MGNRRPLMAANWKMNLSLAEAGDLLTCLKRDAIDFGKVDVLVAPPFTTLHVARETLIGTDILIAAQNMHWEEKGAFTGEISASMLKEAGCSHVVLGHSERRALFFETSEIINRKAGAAIESGLVPIVCVGETLEEREGGRAFDIIRTQLDGSLESFCQKKSLPAALILAYEPVWAIGTGKTATPEQAQEVHRFVRAWLEDNFDAVAAETNRILYGGSVKPDNINELMSQPDIYGALIGGGILKADTFLSIIRFYERC